MAACKETLGRMAACETLGHKIILVASARRTSAKFVLSTKIIWLFVLSSAAPVTAISASSARSCMHVVVVTIFCAQFARIKINVLDLFALKTFAITVIRSISAVIARKAGVMVVLMALVAITARKFAARIAQGRRE